jgi:nucleic acid binding OB-fold tRNA/helicase-type
VNSQRRGVLDRIRRLFSSSELLEAEDLQEQARDCGASPLSDCPDRAKVRIRGTINSVTKLESGGVEAMLTDGTGSIELNWTGRRRLDCITPGCDVMVQGRISSGDNGRVMYNPEFNIVG